MMKKVLTLLLAVVMLLAACPMISAEAEMKTELSNVADDGTAATSAGGVRFGAPSHLNDGKLQTRTVFPYGTGTELTAPTQIPTVTIDMERSWQIEKIVIHDNESEEDVDASSEVLLKTITSNTRAQFEIYGSNDSAFTEKELLFEIDIPAGDATLDTVFPVGGAYTIDLSDKKPVYRYIRYINKTQGYVNMREIEVYANQTTSVSGDATIIHPDLYGAEHSAENNTVTLSFSEDITVTENGVKLYNASGTEIDYASIAASGNTAIITLADEGLDSGFYYVTADSTITNTSGAALKEAQVLFAAESAGSAEATTKLVNVAKGKNVTTLGGVTGGTGSQLTNDNFGTGCIGPKDTTVNAAITFDLERRYSVEKIVIFDNGSDSSPTDHRGQFEIWGADEFDKENGMIIGGEKLFELNVAPDDENYNLDEIFPRGGEYTVNLPDKSAYRYICYMSKVEGAAYNMKEVEIWANVKATAVSTNCTTHTTPNYESATTTGDRAVDGVLDGNYFCCKNGGSGYSTGAFYSTFTVVLGSAKHIGLVEIYGRRGVQYSYSDGLFILYGSNEGTVTDFTASAAEGGATYGSLPEADFEALGYTELYKMSGATSSVTLNDGTTYYTYPKNTADTPLSWSVTLDNSTAYQYITHRKTGTSYNGQFSEFIAYELNPEMFGVENATKKSAVVRFSDSNMDASSLENNIVLLDSDGHMINGGITDVSVMTDSEGKPTADALVSFNESLLEAGKTYKLLVGAGAENTYGTALAESITAEFTLPADYVVTSYSNPAFAAGGENTFSFTLQNNTAQAQEVMAAIALYSGNTLEALDMQKVSVEKDGATEPFEVKATDADATSMKVFIWEADTFCPINYQLAE